jgi:hyperosmotically inducible periplasmic protein
MRSALGLPVTLFALAAFIGQPAQARTQDPAPQPPADNTKVNKRDRSKSEPTADQQTNAKSDTEITQQIRKSVVNDKALSTYAHNVKIITQAGMVTLKGPVRSDDEKRSIESKAAEVVGQDKVTSELAVQPKK